jgi:hypothetical protein
MIDLKLNELPIDAVGDFEEIDYWALSPEQRLEVNERRKAAGLSIFDTVAAAPTMSVGARGVDTSTVETGTGAGAGSITATPSSLSESTTPDTVE